VGKGEGGTKCQLESKRKRLYMRSRKKGGNNQYRQKLANGTCCINSSRPIGGGEGEAHTAMTPQKSNYLHLEKSGRYNCRREERRERRGHQMGKNLYARGELETE